MERIDIREYTWWIDTVKQAFPKLNGCILSTYNCETEVYIGIKSGNRRYAIRLITSKVDIIIIEVVLSKINKWLETIKKENA